MSELSAEEISNLNTIKGLKKRHIKKLFIFIGKAINDLKDDIANIKNIDIPENIKIRIKKLEVEIMGVEEQLVILEDKVRAIESSIIKIDGDLVVAKVYIDNQIGILEDKLITAKDQFNIALQDLDDRKEDKTIEE